MKVAFISTPNFADCDIPLINALQKKWICIISLRYQSQVKDKL